jgi:branched-chain amino acid transport system ATP-binding protein
MLARAIRRMVADAATTTVLVEQHVEVALTLTENAIVLERGRIVHRAHPRELLGYATALDRYIGRRLAGGSGTHRCPFPVAVPALRD